MNSLENYIKSESLLDEINLFIEKNNLEKRIVDIFEDVLQTEKTKDYLVLDHNKRKVHHNLSITTKERVQLSEMMSILFPVTFIDSPVNGSMPLKELEIPKIKAELDSTGFHVFEDLLSADSCDKLIKGLEKVSFHTKKSTKKIKGLTKGNISKINGNTAWVTNQQDLLKIEEVQKLAFDKNLLNLVGQFLGSEPILCQTNSWWSVARSTHRSNLSANAQLFHQDTEYLKFVKVFIYLTDVDENNGPHQYVQGSSKFAQEKLGEGYSPSNRVEDEKAASLFGKENILTFTGKKGSVIIEDTFGLHKGTPVIEGARLLLQLEYCNSLYFHAGYSFGYEGLQEAAVNLSKDYPRVFSNFTSDVEKLNEEKFMFFNKRTVSQKIKDKIKSYL
ncbi:phytanoyl-CoA dioxygenase family protein [Flavobacteriales bacterium]|nr:phytanoyl-CoA dioxygenase family protein [Flavobacteriales bacterium]